MTLRLFTDCHAHLDMPRFESDRAEVIANARQAGVRNIISAGIDLTSSRKAIELAQIFPVVFATAGIHPEEACNASLQDIDTLAELATKPKVVAIGEIGLDFYRDYGPHQKQIEVFKWQLEMASHNKLPVVIHSRQAEADLIPILDQWLESHPAKKPGVIHCFNGTMETALRYQEMGFYISLGGYIGYPSAKAIREVVKQLPIDRIVLETDSPFLPPQSHRGERNEPAYILDTAIELARIKGLSLEEAARATSENAGEIFSIF